MKSIHMQRGCSALVFVVSVCLAVWLVYTRGLEAAFAVGIVSALSLLFLLRKNRMLFDATLIMDNRIITVPVAVVSVAGRQIKKHSTEAIVSTFGILIGNKVFRWGHDGMHGARLQTVRIEKERMHLTFGNEAKTETVVLLHGITRKQTMLDAAQKLMYETGVTAEIVGW